MWRLWQRVSATRAERLRTAGEPSSSNGASSFHLFWDLQPEPLIEVAATLEVLLPPSVKRLYFWALQVTFASGRRLRGGGHLGLQWNARHPGGTAVNWGGYVTGSGEQLRGSDSILPSVRRIASPNTRDFDWRPGERYRFHIGPGGDAPEGLRAWRGTVTHVESGTATVVRDLYVPADTIVSPVVWSEVFARCEHPMVSVRWSGLAARTIAGKIVRPSHVRVNYQARERGGCDNTTVAVDELGLLQVTSVERSVPQGATLPVPDGPLEV
jgi:hypothetical protein